MRISDDNNDNDDDDDDNNDDHNSSSSNNNNNNNKMGDTQQVDMSCILTFSLILALVSPYITEAANPPNPLINKKLKQKNR